MKCSVGQTMLHFSQNCSNLSFEQWISSFYSLAIKKELQHPLWKQVKKKSKEEIYVQWGYDLHKLNQGKSSSKNCPHHGYLQFKHTWRKTTQINLISREEHEPFQCLTAVVQSGVIGRPVSTKNRVVLRYLIWEVAGLWNFLEQVDWIPSPTPHLLRARRKYKGR